MGFREMFTSISSKTRLALLLGIISIVVYANTFRNGYVLDDNAAITNNTIVNKGVTAIPELFTTPYLYGYIKNANGLYRPLSLATFAIEHDAFGSAPIAAHIINVLLFALCVIFLFFFLDILLDRKNTGVAFVAALFFSLHPVHTEVVANVKSRDELLCFLFGMLALLSFCHYVAKGRRSFLIAGGLSFLLSLLSKESSITLLFIIPLIFFCYRNEHKQKSVYITITAIIAAALFLFFRFSILNKYNANHPFLMMVSENSLVLAHTYPSRIATAIYILGSYMRLLFVPFPLICDYSFNTIPIVSFANGQVLISAAVYISILFVAVWRLFRNRKDPLAFALLFFVITLSLFSNVFFLVGATMAERFLFFPSVGYCLAAALLVMELSKIKPVALAHIPLVLIVLVSVTYSLLTIDRNSKWKSAYTLYKNDLGYNDKSYRLFYYAGTELLNRAIAEPAPEEKRKLYAHAVDTLKRSIQIYPDDPVACAEIASGFFELSRYDSAKAYYTIAIDASPRDTMLLNKLAGVLFKLQDYEGSIEQCEKIVAIDSTYSRAYRNMGACYLKLAHFDSAIVVLKKAIVLEPDVPSVYGFLAYAYSGYGAADSAKKYETIAQEFNPSFRLQ